MNSSIDGPGIGVPWLQEYCNAANHIATAGTTSETEVAP